MAQPESLTRDLADFLAGLNGRVEDRLLRQSVDALIDTLGCMVFGATQTWSQAAIAHALATGGAGSATVIGQAAKTTPAMAAFANGSSAHAFELDDVHEEAINHPGAVVVPAAFGACRGSRVIQPGSHRSDRHRPTRPWDEPVSQWDPVATCCRGFIQPRCRESSARQPRQDDYSASMARL